MDDSTVRHFEVFNDTTSRREPLESKCFSPVAHRIDDWHFTFVKADLDVEARPGPGLVAQCIEKDDCISI